LITFQNICLLSKESHKLDGWMVRFLLEHSLALKTKGLPSAQLYAGVDSGRMSTKAKELTELGRYTDFKMG
jgi:hypothetical protein